MGPAPCCTQAVFTQDLDDKPLTNRPYPHIRLWAVPQVAALLDRSPALVSTLSLYNSCFVIEDTPVANTTARRRTRWQQQVPSWARGPYK
jgi:hypothetical protein